MLSRGPDGVTSHSNAAYTEISRRRSINEGLTSPLENLGFEVTSYTSKIPVSPRERPT